jgi:23S rRNA pseudouridine2605 synthase
VTRNRRPYKKPMKRGAGTDDGDRQGDRLQKVLAAAGLGSRRECEELIVTGRVEIDGQTTTKLGTRVDPLKQDIRVDGVSLPRPKRLHYVLNKPPGVVCTNNDPSGRLRAIDLVRSGERLFTIGRLDRTSEGMILITNDGELANRLTHPRYGVEKRYLVRIVGSPNPVIFEKLKKGIHLAEGIARVSDIRVRKRSSKFTDVEIVLQEGRNREIRRILARIGHKVVRLKRIAIGPLKLGELPVGESRSLTRDEVKQLQLASEPNRRKDRSPKAKSSEPRSAAGASRHSERQLDSEKKQKPTERAGQKPARKAPDRKTPAHKAPDRKTLERFEADERPTLPKSVELELDEVEVTEVPTETSPGIVIGDEDWGSPSASNTEHTSSHRKRRES